MKSATSLQEALLELAPRVRELAVQPVMGGDDLVERTALWQQVSAIHVRMYSAGLDPSKLAPDWQTVFLQFQRENFRAENILEQKNSLAGRLEFQRYQMMREGRPPVVTPDLHPDPQARFLHSNVFPAMAAEPQKDPPKQTAPAGAVRLKMSEVLQRYLNIREKQDGDRRAESEVGPIIKFAIAVLNDPVMFGITGDDILNLKDAIPDIPTKRNFPKVVGDDLYLRWKHVTEHGWSFERDDKVVHFKRTSETLVDGGWTLALESFWQFAIKHRFAPPPVPDFELSTVKNPGAVERDAFTTEELIKFLSSPPFTGCEGKSRPWTPGKFLYQGFFYWGELIELLNGMRPAETAQLRCRDIIEMYDKPHFRFARLSPEQEKKARFAAQPGGNQGKTGSAFRCLPIHRILVRLGVVERRNAIVADYIARCVRQAGGRDRLSEEQFSKIQSEAGEQWLFPDWPVYVKNTGEIKWSHALSKAFSYGIKKLKMVREGLTQYSARHFFKGVIDDTPGLSERSRKIIMGHSTKGDVSHGYGPKFLTEEQSEVAEKLCNRSIWRLALILIRAKRRAEKGELVVIDSWRNDMRSTDEKFQAALAHRAELYQKS